MLPPQDKMSITSLKLILIYALETVGLVEESASLADSPLNSGVKLTKQSEC